ncbi:HNH endonuclease family protein [Corynebacterium sp.]|uniref:HNH endonuclease family protein n=1 Tax=Corynebacterium sp. TaxID=1720 RepID=UPI0026DBAE5C|nr:HNH endonuclease family protein [Corynebacterium sp.]MDO5032927.1 HNH endonuclease family protein [Corynebacterium sp.]
MATRTPFIAAGILNLAIAAAVAVGCAAQGQNPGSDTAAPTEAATTTPTAPTMPATGVAPPSSSDNTPPPSEDAAGAAAPADAFQEMLAEIEVKGRAPKTGYERAQFGQAWSDDVTVEFGHNGCDTRNDILRRDLREVTLKEGTHDCVVLSGVLDDPYSGTEIPFRRGRDTSSRVQIDHVVPLADAWQKGAQQWAPEKRRDFANDPRNLLAVDGPLNQQKGAGDAATWLPPNKAFRCEYARRIVEVKHSYGVWVTEAEQQALGRLLAAC